MCERNIGCRSHTPGWDLGHNPGKCPDWEWDWQHFGSQTGAQSTEPHQPGLKFKMASLLAHSPPSQRTTKMTKRKILAFGKANVVVILPDNP